MSIETPAPALRLAEATPEEPSDDALMLSSAAGDRRAFADLVTRHEVRVRRYCRASVGDSAAAEDVAQDVFLRIWSARGRYRPRGSFEGYLFTIARNLCRSRARRATLRQFVGFGEEPHHWEPDLWTPGFEGAVASRQQSRLIRAALDALPEKFRTPLVLRFVEELDYDTIAEVIGRTPSAARSRVHYGLKALGRKLPKEMAPWNP